MVDLLMLLPVTSLYGGKTNNTVVRAMYAREILSVSISGATRLEMRSYQINEPSNSVRQLPLPFGERSPALQAVDENGHGIGEIESHNCSGNDGIKGTIRCKYDFKFDS